MQRHARFLFLERAPFMGVELLDLIEDYRIGCYGQSPEFGILHGAWPVEAKLADRLDVPANDEAVRRLLADPAFIGGLTAGATRALGICFYMDQAIADGFQRIGLKTALPEFHVQRDLGSKVKLGAICSAAQVPLNASLVIRSDGKPDVQFEECRKRLGVPFVVQSSAGVSGEETDLIESPAGLADFCTSLQGDLRASRFLPNVIPLSLHLCISDARVLVRGPFLQLIGLPELSLNPFQFAGNDTGQALLTPELQVSAVDIAKRLGSHVARAGYVGVLGVDLLWDLTHGTLYVQELNTRLVGLTRLLSGMQKDLGLYPDLLEHLSLFGHPQLTAKAVGLRRSESPSLEGSYSQLLLFNTQAPGTVDAEVLPGIYRFKRGELRFSRPGLFLERLREDEVLVAFARGRGEYASHGDLLARVLLKQSVLRCDAYALDRHALSLIGAIRSAFFPPGECHGHRQSTI